MFSCTISVIFFLIRSESRAPCHRDVKKRLPVKVHRWRSQKWFQRWRNLSTWFLRSPWSTRENLRKTWMSGRPGECRWRDRVVKLAQGNLCRPPKAQKSSILKWEDRKELKIQILWNGTTGRYLRTQPVQGDSYGQQRQAQSFKTWSKWTVSTWRRSSISY